MNCRMLDGKVIAASLRQELEKRAAAVAEARGSSPHLAILVIGGDESSQIYLRSKLQACKAAGIECTVEALPERISETEVLRLLSRLGQDPTLDGIILDLPIPKRLNAHRLTEAIVQDKDVEGVTTANFGRLFREKSFSALTQSDVMIPCTPSAIIRLLRESEIEPSGKEAVVVGRSNIVGKPTAHLLSCLDATVTLCHSRTSSLEPHVRRADILVACAGIPKLIPGEWIKTGAIVLDAGLHKDGKRLVGDVDLEAAEKRAAALTPVPGGVGPLTVTYLLHNIVVSAERRTQQQLG